MVTTEVTYRKIWNIAYPIILGSVAQNLISVTDTAFLGRVGEIALGAGAIGGLYYLAIVMLAWGFGIGLQIIIARRFGEGNLTEIGRTLKHGALFLLPLGLLLFLFMRYLSDPLLGKALQSGEIFRATMEYTHIRAFGLFFAFLNILFRSFYVGIARTGIITITTTLLALINIILDYALIFGHFGLPEMGIRGAALASVIAEASATVFFFVFTWTRMPHRQYGLFNTCKIGSGLYLRILKVSFPVMLQNFISIGTWFIFFLLVEHMGERELAISNIIRSFYVVLMIPMWGFSSATNTLVSYLMGQGRQGEVMSLVNRILVMCLTGVAAVVVLGLIFPRQALGIYTDSQVLIEGSLALLYVVSLAALLLSVGFILFNAVSGTGRTQVTFGIEVVVVVIYLAYVYAAVYWWRSSIEVVWTSEYVYGGLMAIGAYIYLLTGRWRSSRI